MRLNNCLIFTSILLIQGLNCCNKKEESKNELKQAEGYIVGFDPCTIRHQRRIGYVFISTDLKDTLVTYNLSDSTFKMPASIYLNPADTLYRIPESYFQNFWESAYLPAETRYYYIIKITYTFAKYEELNFNKCATDINQSDFLHQFGNHQVVIKSASKPN